MITYINPANAEKYSVLFTEFSNVIGEPITSLDEYFGKLHDVVTDSSLDQDLRIKFTKLPLDEDYFVIDANTRKISVPTDFTRNGVGVLGDNKAEVLFFQIDRYFDSTDLFNNTIQICIQWQAPDGQKGISGNYGKFLEIEPVQNGAANKEKVVFGWIIDSRMTAAAGRLRFAVHFIEKDLENNLSYALNTMPAELGINSTLAVADITELDPDSVIRTNEEMLSRITSNGIYDLGGTIPSSPEFAASGLEVAAIYAPTSATEDAFVFVNNIPVEYDDQEGQKYVLVSGSNYISDDKKEFNMPNNGIAILKTSAKATIGNLNYQWLQVKENGTRVPLDVIDDYVYIPVEITSASFTVSESNSYYYLDDESDSYKKFPYVGNFNVSSGAISFNNKTYDLYTKVVSEDQTTGQARLEYVLVVPTGATQEDSTLEEGRQYYKKENNRYIKITDNIYVKTNIDEDDYAYSIGSETGDPVDIYAQNIVYNLKDNTNIVGSYVVKAQAKSGINTKEVTMLTSNGVIVKAPVIPEISLVENTATDVNIEGTIHRVLSEGTTSTLAIACAQVTGVDNGFDTTYQWKKNDEDISGATSSSYVMDLDSATKAVFNCEVTYTKNHASTSAISNNFVVSVPASEPSFGNITERPGAIVVKPTGFTGIDVIDVSANIIGEYPAVVLPVNEVINSDSLKYVWVKANIAEYDNYNITADAYSPHLSAADLATLGIPDSPWTSSNADTIDTLITTQPEDVPVSNQVYYQANRDGKGYYYCILINEFNTDKKYTVSNFIHFN